jgi:imidazole glycerol-phosphate synthase subunit HisH
MSSVAVIDYGMGNLHSIAKALQHADTSVEVKVTDDPGVILSADRVVFPGVGAMRDCMAALKARDLVKVVEEAAVSRPVLGICLGMQALLSHSEENGGVESIGLIPGEVVRFSPDLTSASGDTLKIPHMGWNRVRAVRPHPLFEGIPDGSWFYFVHSFYARPTSPEDIAGTTDYPTPFASALIRDKLAAVQFHPEKSQEAGLRLLRNFLSWVPSP